MVLQARPDAHEPGAETVTEVGASTGSCTDAALGRGAPQALLGHQMSGELDVQGVHGGSFPE